MGRSVVRNNLNKAIVMSRNSYHSIQGRVYYLEQSCPSFLTHLLLRVNSEQNFRLPGFYFSYLDPILDPRKSTPLVSIDLKADQC